MYYFIVNPRSGNNKGMRAMGQISLYLGRQGIAHTVHFTKKGYTAIDIARMLDETLPKEGVHNIITLGGDGSFSETINGFKDLSRYVFGFVPTGRGNDFNRCAKFPKNPIQAVKDILKNNIVEIDYIDAGTRRCLNVCGTGMDVEVLERVEALPKSNVFSYLKALIGTLKKLNSEGGTYTMTLQVDGGETRTIEEVIMIGACNGTSFGGNIRVSPNSAVRDGKMHVIAICKPKGINVLRVLPGFIKGKHIWKSYAEEIICETAKIRNLSGNSVEVDGEVLSGLNFDASIVKNGLKIFATGKFGTTPATEKKG